VGGERGSRDGARRGGERRRAPFLRVAASGRHDGGGGTECASPVQGASVPRLAAPAAHLTPVRGRGSPHPNAVITDTRTLVPPIAPASSGPSPGQEPLVLRANKLDLLERLADDLAHEIKNPLHSMVINLEVLKRRVARADSPDEVQRYIGVLAGELERVNRRIELLLRLSRPGRGPESTTLNELTEELMELIQLEARHVEAQVEYLPQQPASRVFVPREPTRQAILNLVLEVIDHMRRGGTLRLAVTEREGRARLAVDDGASAVPAIQAAAEAPRLAAAAALAAAVDGLVEIDEDDGAPLLVLSLPVASTG
jgi:hypothetical protein